MTFFRSACLALTCWIALSSGVEANCPVGHDKLRELLRSSVKPSGGPANGGFENQEWAAVVGRDGIVCAIVFSGDQIDDQWPGSRAVSMEKATTANAFSLKSMALSTANLVFGGGLALYDANGIAGGLGMSGDSACADHNVAWRVRKALGLDKVPAGVNPRRKDAIVYDVNSAGHSASGFGHPKCAGREAEVADQIEAGVGGVPLK
jgi:uncharacterized protein GlcG (DUF336 family)